MGKSALGGTSPSGGWKKLNKWRENQSKKREGVKRKENTIG